jgi:outer membrane usher protein
VSKGLIFTWILVLALAMTPRAASGDDAVPDPLSDQKLLLEVQINGQSIGKVGEFTLRNGRLMAMPEELHDLGIRVPDSAPRQPGGEVFLSDLPGLRWIYDQENQIVKITAGAGAFLPQVLQPAKWAVSEGHRRIESGTGLTVNYDVVSTFASGQASATGSFDMRAFSPYGILSSGWLGYAGSSSGGPDSGTRVVRLDTTYSFADVNTMFRYAAGDFITGGLAWTRPVHIAGFQVRKDFSMRPDLVTFPMPAIGGSAAVPSTVNILADGNLVVTSSVGAGPFEAPQLPVVTGAGNITMTVTNALGQQVTVTQPFYASSSMLAPGLHSFAVQAGWVRRNWGVDSNDYGKIAAAGMFRTGVTPKFTFEASAEGTPGAVMAGAGGVAQIGNLGVVNFAAAVTGGGGQAGALVAAGAQRIGRKFSLGASAIFATHSYRDIAAVNGGGVLSKQFSGFASVSQRHFGSAGVAFAGVDQDAGQNLTPLNLYAAQHSRVLSVNYSRAIHHMALYASEFKDFGSTTGSAGFQVGLTIPLGRRNMVDISGTSDGNVQIYAQQPAVLVGQWGYDALLAAGNSTHIFAEGTYKSPVGQITAGVDQNAGQLTGRVETQGALSMVDRALFASNLIYDSFAIVDTGAMAHVHVFQENRDVGLTNSWGRLLVPDLRSFDVNHIAIEATDIPADATISDPSRVVRPQDRSGVVVKFPIVISHGALVRLTDEAGAPIPLGSVARLKGVDTPDPVGYEGDAFIESLTPHNELTVTFPDGRTCTVAFDYRSVPGDLPSIGPLRCIVREP